MAQSSKKIRVAINGGGLAGASLFHALLPHQHLDIHIFERASTFKEAGAAIGITRNALNALDLIGPSAVQCLERAGAVPHLEALSMLAQGPDTGELVSEITDSKRLVNIVSRAAFLRELLASAPPERMHTSKTLSDARSSEKDGPVILQFEDGTTHECDILIGADGIHSQVRKFILGKDDPAASPVSAGWWVVQALRPYSEMQMKLPKELVDVDNPRELGWLGDHTFLHTTFLSDGNQIQFVLVGCHDGKQAPTQWHGKVSAQEIRNLYQDWPTQLFETIDELLCNVEYQDTLYTWEHLPARTYVSRSLCIMGDAAHSTTPWQGSGGGMSIEDSLILSAVLGQADSPKEAIVGLQIYDQLRRDRTQRIVESSRGTGLILTGQDQTVGLDAGKIRAKLRSRWDFILDFDIKEHRDKAIQMMKERTAR